MSYDTGLQTIVAGVELALQAPVGAAGQQLAAVTVQNLSPLTIAVTVGPNVHTLPPYTVDQYRLPSTGTQVRLLGANQSGSDISTLPSQIDAIWYDADGLGQSGTFPSPLNPDPLALGLAIAEELLNQGVPSVLIEDVLINTVIPAFPAPGSTIGPIDISKYASLVIICENPVTGQFISLFCSQATGTSLVTDQETVAAVAPSPVVNAQIAAKWAVSGQNLTLTNFSGGPLTLNVIGTNRAVPVRYSTEANVSQGDTWQAGSTTYAVGNTAVLAQNPNNVQLQGQCFLDYHINNTVLKGNLFLTSPAGVSFILASATELAALTATQLGVTKMVAVPAAGYTLGFQCTAAGTGIVVAHLLQCNL